MNAPIFAYPGDTVDAERLIYNIYHNDPDNENMLNRQKLSNLLKWKAVNNSPNHPVKIIQKEFKKRDIIITTIKSIRAVKSKMYYARRKLIPTLPTIMDSLHGSLNDFDVKTNNDENFLLCNDKINNIILFSTAQNYTFLCNLNTVFVDGKFNSYPTQFK